MGTIKKTNRKYATPSHPWQRSRLEEEKKLVNEYGFKNKKEVWKSSYLLKNFKGQAKRLIANASRQGELEKKQLIDRLRKYGLADENTRMENVLNLSINNIMDRRLQSIVFRNKLARTIKQARQFIIHGHVFVDTRKITTPSYLVTASEESKIIFDPASSLASLEHPERAQLDLSKKAAKEEKRERAKQATKRRGRDRRR